MTVWDEHMASNLLGSKLLVGLYYMDGDRCIRQRQIFGVVLSVCPKLGISLRTKEGDLQSVAPLLDLVRPAQAGRYDLEDGTTVNDPDFTIGMAIMKPVRH